MKIDIKSCKEGLLIDKELYDNIVLYDKNGNWILTIAPSKDGLSVITNEVRDKRVEVNKEAGFQVLNIYLKLSLRS